ncbi:MAG TPA: hypothetical protein VEF90_08890 [Xanthobacteraceae bacterium]|nr:hypothetical protein [Xanthobacteraceae bacterium]
MALQLVLSFGHVHLHGIGAGASHSTVAATHNSAPAPAPRQHPAQNTPDDDDYCAICASIFLVSNSLVSTPPALPLPVGFARIEHSLGTTGAVTAPRLVAFQSRAPPAA